MTDNLATLNFREWETPHGVAGSALFQENLATGIYVLVFENGEEYVGQTVNFMHRFSTHRRHYADIKAVRFAPVSPENLDEVERQLIAQKNYEEGVKLRNIDLMSLPMGPSALDQIIDKQTQAEWLRLDSGFVPSVSQGRLETIDKNRCLKNPRVAKLMDHIDGPEVLDAIACFVYNAVPQFDVLEGSHWVLTVMPHTAKTPTNRRLATLSVHNVELLFIGEMKIDDEWLPYTALNTGRIEKVPRQLRPYSKGETDNYRSAGTVHQFFIGGADALWDLFEYDQVLLAARSLVLGQMRKGRAAHSRFHNRDFADLVYHRINELITE